MIKRVLINYVVIMVSMLALGTIFVVVTGGEPGDIGPLLLGATVAGLPLSIFLARRERS